MKIISVTYANEAEDILNVVTPDGCFYIPVDMKNIDYLKVIEWCEKGGVIKAFVPPEVELTIPDAINRRQFFQQAHVDKIVSEEEALLAMSGTIPEVMLTSIEKLPTEYQFPAKALIIGAQVFERSNPLCGVVAQSLGMSEIQIKQFWLEASKL